MENIGIIFQLGNDDGNGDDDANADNDFAVSSSLDPGLVS